MAAVEGQLTAGVGRRKRERGHYSGGDEAEKPASVDFLVRVNKAEERRGSVEGAVAAEEAGVGDGAEPWLADEGGAEEALGLVRWEAEEDLGDDVADQLPRRRRHGVGRSQWSAELADARQDWGFFWNFFVEEEDFFGTVDGGRGLLAIGPLSSTKSNRPILLL